MKTLAVGTTNGKIVVWNLDENDPNDIRQTVLSHPKLKRVVRSTDLSLNGKYLLATSDDSCIWIWKDENN
jgi:hypothetical protein